MKKLVLIMLISVSSQVFANTYFDLIPSEYLVTCMKIQFSYEIPSKYLYTLPEIESNWNETALSHANSYGLTQINLKYVDYFVENFWIHDYRFDIHNPHHNLELGFAYLRHLKNRFGSWELALASYNGGATTVRKVLAGEGEYPQETINYIEKFRKLGVTFDEQ